MRVLILSLALLLPGCAMFQPSDIPVSQSLPVAAQNAQKAINEANVTLTAAANVVSQNFADGILTKEEAQSYIAKIEDYAKKVDSAKKLLDGGDILGAQNQAELLSKLIVALHREVAAKARQK